MKLHKHNATRHTCGTLRPWRRSMRVLCVAEKPSIAKSIAQILSRGSYTRRNGRDKYCQNYDFPYRLPRHLFGGRVAQQGAMIGVDMTFTSVRGHMMKSIFQKIISGASVTRLRYSRHRSSHVFPKRPCRWRRI